MRSQRIVGPPEVRFWPKVDKDGPIPEYAPHLGPCWLWLAAQNGQGYGVFRLPDRRNVRAHRWAYEALVGPIPDRLQLDHLCRIRHCVNPAHLEIVTNAENARRGLPGDRSLRKVLITHCPQSHEYTEVNTYYEPQNGARQCRECRRERSRKAAAKAKERRHAMRL